MRICVPTIAAKTDETEKVALAPMAYCNTKLAAAAGTEITAATPAAAVTEDLVLGRIFLTRRKIA